MTSDWREDEISEFIFSDLLVQVDGLTLVGNTVYSDGGSIRVKVFLRIHG